MHTGFVWSFRLKVMICSCQHFFDNLSFTDILNRFIFDRVYDSWILSLLLFTLAIMKHDKILHLFAHDHKHAV